MENVNDFIDFVHYDLSIGCPRIKKLKMAHLNVLCNETAARYLKDINDQLEGRTFFNDAQTLAFYDVIKIHTISRMVVDQLYDAYFMLYYQAMYMHRYYSKHNNIVCTTLIH